ncbi:MAG: cadmium-translocating P-type ATPase [Candidatus Latescibacteria bacterium]|nr:cadmium-translocating P-type ATPase [Candidatus Latescibacterota bacterium]
MASCAQCGLPLAGRAFRARHQNTEAGFCCYGCYLVLQLTSQPGEEGKVQTIQIRLGLGLFFAMNVMVFNLPTYFPFVYPAAEAEGGFMALLGTLSMLFALPVLLLLGLPILWQSARQLRQGVLEVDALIALGTFAAYGLSVHNALNGGAHFYFDTAAMLLVLVTLGRYWEATAKVKAARALETLLGQVPAELTVIRQGRELVVPSAEVAPGDRVRVLPGQVFPADGIVEQGEGGVDESSLTGEAGPVFREPGNRCSSGSFSLDGVFVVRVERPPDQSAAARITRLLAEAQHSRAPVQLLADRIAAAFVPAVVVLALGVLAYWTAEAGIEKGLLVCLAVLVISCPCALGIATPMALWVGLGRAARRGVLVRNGEALELLARTRQVFFDKTGTLSTGQLQYLRAEGAGAEDLAGIGLLASRSPHPIGAGLRQVITPALLPVEGFRLHPGLGVEGRVGERLLWVGSQRFMERAGMALDPELANHQAEGEVMALAAWEGRVRAALFFREQLRPEAAAAVQAVRGQGLGVQVLTGDTKALPAALQAQFPGVVFRTGLLPEDKVAAVRQARQHGVVAMVGDGINDAPALAAAEVGIAMGTGADLTREAAAVNILGSELDRVPWLLAYARRVRRVVWGNLFWAFFYNLLAVGLAVTGRLNPLVAALAMVVSSLFVIGNSRRLRQG